MGTEDRCWPAIPVGGELPAYPLADNLSPHGMTTDAVTKDMALQKTKRIYGKKELLNFFWTLIGKYSLLPSLNEDIRKNNWKQFWIDTCKRRTFLFVVNIFFFPSPFVVFKLRAKSSSFLNIKGDR